MDGSRFPEIGQVFDQRLLADMLAKLHLAGVRVWVLDGSLIHDMVGTFSTLGALFRMPAPLIWSDLYNNFERHVLPLTEPSAIIWFNADLSLKQNLAVSVDLFRHLDNLTEPCYRTVDDLQGMRFYMTGNGIGFEAQW